MIIGLIGRAGTGKTSVANILSREREFNILPFASPIKAMLKVGLGLTEADLNGKAKESPCDKLLGETPRYALQTLGTEWGRGHIHPDIWLKAWFNMWDKYGRLPTVADDVRFPNEIDLIRSLGGKVIQVEAGNEPRVQPVTAEDHPSEHMWRLREPDYTIINNSDLPGLEQRVLRCIDAIIQKEATPA